jgi:hypothetical protein
MGHVEPILNIYISKAFQWYKELFHPMSFDAWNCFLKIQDSVRTPTPKVGVHLGVCGLIPSHSLTLWECKYDYWITFLAHTFPCLYFDREPKAKVMTHIICIWNVFFNSPLNLVMKNIKRNLKDYFINSVN